MSAFGPAVPAPPPLPTEAQIKAAHEAAWDAAQKKIIENAFQVLGAIEVRVLKSLMDAGDPRTALALADIAARERISNLVRIYCAFVSNG
jgi:hypothetical protein